MEVGMRPMPIGLAVVAALASSLVGASGLGSVASAQPGCGGAAYQEPCDYDSRDEQEGYDEREYPTFTPEESAWLRAWGERETWAGTRLAAEKAVATWWRLPALSSNFYAETGEVWSRNGALVEQVPNEIAGDARYPVAGSVSVSRYSSAEWVTYECDVNYGDAQSGGCVPADRDYDCGELRSWGIASIPVIGEDWMLLDDDGDGWDCEPLVTVLPVPTPNPCDGLVGTVGCFLFGP
jgi:hypothetical protein